MEGEVPGSRPLVGRFERFAGFVADGCSPSTAYLLARGRVGSRNGRREAREAAEWLAMPDVGLRIDYLLAVRRRDFDMSVRRAIVAIMSRRQV